MSHQNVPGGWLLSTTGKGRCREVDLCLPLCPIPCPACLASRGVFPGLRHSVAWLWGRICRGNNSRRALVPLPHQSLSWPCHHAPPQRCICSASALPARPGTKPRALIKMRGLVHLASTLLARCCLLCDTFLSIIFHPAHCHGIRVSPGQHGEASVQGRAGQSLQRHKDALKIEVCCWCRW